MTPDVAVTGASLTLAEVDAVAHRGASAGIDDATRERIRRGNAVLVAALAHDERIYGGNTGVEKVKRAAAVVNAMEFLRDHFEQE